MSRASSYPSYTAVNIGSLQSIPEAWRAVRARFLCEVTTGSGDTADAVPDGDYPFYVRSQTPSRIDSFTFNDEAVLTAGDGAGVGKVFHHVEGKFNAHQRVYVLHHFHGVTGRFFFYFFSTFFGEIALDGSAKSTVDSVRRHMITDMPFAVPPIAEQSQITAYFDRETAKIDALIGKQDQLIATLRERRRALFGNVLDRASGPSVRLRYLFQPSSECDAPTEEVLSVYREYGVILKSSRSDNFNRTPENLDRYLLVHPGDLVVNKMKAWQGSLGISNHRGIVSPDYEVLRKTDPLLLGSYAHHLLRSPGKIAEYALRSIGIRPSQWRLYWDQLGDIRVVLPPEAEQRKIADHLDEQTTKIDVLIEKAQRFIELSKERRSALISAAVTGQIDVRGEVDIDENLTATGEGAA
ncbi:MAG: hypothetical protein DLM58_12130 [Pseudonocardiales bacterium]|nr:MAG: hypothetical protein DLM58_12130 [Pseudonocardiales bacterium]